jgi:glycosyltransferase involved in cell wall biosynthesis
MDPCPTVVIEALACGLPVVGLESGGLPELVDAQSGRLIPVPRDWDAMHTPSASLFARAVKEIAERWSEFSAHARRGAEERFAAERWVNRHREIFTQVLKSAKVTA